VTPSLDVVAGCICLTVPCILVGAPLDVKKRGNRRAEKEMTGVDDGGLTRALVSSIFSQLADLTFDLDRVPSRGQPRSSPDVKFHLFVESKGRLSPQGNDFLNRKIRDDADASLTVKAYYRAIGRVILYAIRNNMPIPSNILPNVHRNYLLRDVKPLSTGSPLHSYHGGDLVEDVCAMLPRKLDNVGTVDYILCGLSSDVNYSRDPRRALEEFKTGVQKRYIDQYDVALTALQEGLTHNHRINVHDAFRHAPLHGLDQLIFCKYEVEPDDLIATLDIVTNFGDLCDDAKIEILQANISRVLHLAEDGTWAGHFPDLIRDRYRTDKQFPQKVLYFATGHKCIRVHDDDFKLMVEFNVNPEFNVKTKKFDPDWLPMGHTCGFTLKFPAQAYDGDRETLEKKLDQSLAEVAGAEFTIG
jgi:hypothetical protein